MKPLLIPLIAALLAGCAATLQTPEQPGPGFAGPRLEAGDFVSFDGARLGLTHWDSQPSAEPWAVVVGVHGMNDYANAFHLAAPFWAARGIATYAYDQRGFGRSPERGIWAPDGLKVEDLRTLVALVRARYPGAVIAVAGESMGGAVAMEAFASDRPPAADRLILLSPAVWGWSTQALPNKTLLWIAARLAPGKTITPPRWLTAKITPTDNRSELIAMGRDPLMVWGARSDTLYGLVGTMERAWKDAGAITGPTLYLYGARDEIIPRTPAFEAAHRLPASDRTGYYARGWHLLLRDRQAATVWADVAAFIRDPAAPLPSGAPPIPPPSGVVGTKAPA
ncbi:MAG TPA: alpha/beta hydrolase [Caulobacteraceae bacterium]|nr:alpha/beta hydrolase [Caulobacteraceae bacterium]